MSIQDKINDDIKSAMIEKNVDKLAALRAVKSAFLLEMSKDGSTSVSNTIAQSIILKLVKQRKDSYDIYIQKDRVDLATDEMNQISYLNDYLPDQMSEDERAGAIRKAIESAEDNTEQCWKDLTPISIKFHVFKIVCMEYLCKRSPFVLMC